MSKRISKSGKAIVKMVGRGDGNTYKENRAGLVMHKHGEKENSQSWWCLKREDDRIETFIKSREQLLKESLPLMENQSVDGYLRAFLDIRKSQYAEDLRRCKSQEEKDVVTAFWRSYFMDVCGHDPQDEYNSNSEHFTYDLSCPCGYEGTVTYGQMDFELLGKDRKGFLYFKCPECKRHLQYDPITGKIRSRKGISGLLFGRFS